ncbi:MAG: nth [Dehalococcoidia bacterium]|nr:nth [Dehalococcoidia bacterium]
MRLPISQPLDLAATLESGQAFRWRRQGEWHYGVVGENLVALKQGLSHLEVRSSPSSPEHMETPLRNYLRLDDDLEAIYSRIGTDPVMRRAIASYRGLRLLRQDPWECLVSFICSANSNIPRISATVQALAQGYGQPLSLGDYVDYTFPTPERLAEAGEAALRALKLGFRAKYVAQVAERVARGEVRLEPLRSLPYQEAREALTSLPGVGDKVADCVLLFSLDKLEAFPVDRWVRRAVEESYLDGAKLSYKALRAWALERWGTDAGYAQQYLFHAMRLQGREKGEVV